MQNLQQPGKPSKKIYSIFLIFSAISLISFATITSFTLQHNLSTVMDSLEDNARQSELNSIVKNMELYIENKVSYLKDMSQLPPVITAIMNSANGAVIRKQLSKTLLANKKIPFAVYDFKLKQVTSSSDDFSPIIQEENAKKLLDGEKTYLVNFRHDFFKNYMEITFPIYYVDSIEGFIVADFSFQFEDIFGNYDEKIDAFAIRQDGEKIISANFDEVQGNIYEKNIPSFDAILIFKPSYLLKKFHSNDLTFKLLLSILLSAFISAIIQFFIGKNLLLEPYQDLSSSQKEIETIKNELELMLDNSTAMILYKNTNDEILRVNKKLANFVGFDPEEIIGQETNKFWSHGCFVASNHDRTIIRSRRAFYGVEDILISDDKEELLVSVDKIPIEDLNGEIKGILIFAHDVTEQQKATKEISDLKQAMENAVEGIAQINSKGHIVFVNEAFASSLNYKVIQLINKNWLDLIVQSDHSKVERAYSSMLVKGKNSCEVKGLTKDGEVIYQHLTLVPDINQRGSFIGFYLFMQDITRRKLQEELILSQTKELARSNQELEQFAYVVSHDLQEPLRTISSYAELLEKKMDTNLLDAKLLKYYNYIQEGTVRMKDLITDLLTYSRAGKSKSIEKVDLNQILSKVSQSLSARIKETDAKLEFDKLPVIHANARELQQLFQNLIANAIKFKKEDTQPIVNISYEENSEDYQFCIEDNGIGIEEEHLEKIFVVFKRLHARNKFEGTGIGLSICKRIVENHNGQIWVESEPGKGTRFLFTINKSLNATDEQAMALSQNTN